MALETAGIRAAVSVLGKALAPLSGNLVSNWAATSSLAPNIKDLETELLCAQAMLESAKDREIHNQALAKLLLQLRGLAYGAEDVLDELDYFRIQDELEGTFETIDRGCFDNLVRDARHTFKSATKQLRCTSCLLPACCKPRQHGGAGAEPGQLHGGAGRRICATSPCCGGANDTDEEESCKCLPQLTNRSRSRDTVGKRSSSVLKIPIPILDHDLQPRSSNMPINNGKQNICGVCTPTCMAPWNKQSPKTPKLDFDRVDASRRMRHIADELQKIRDKISPILDRELKTSARTTDIATPTTERKTTTQSIEPKFYGRVLEKNTIIANITKGKCLVENLNVVSIVGPGGIGKTTLAQEVYNNPDVRNHFHLKIWICVSLSFSLDRLTKEIAKSILIEEGKSDAVVKSYNLDQLQREIENNLKNKRLLLVLDDIWQYGDGDDWKTLLFPLRKGQVKGSVVLVTTRFLGVAQTVKTTDTVIQLDRFSPVDFWNYFMACVFDHDESKQLPEGSDLNSIAKQIVEKLKGSPLAAKTVGKLLKKELTPNHWKRVLESKEWESQTGKNDIMPALKLSYNYLRFDLQQCFSYCALFPEDYKFYSEELIRFWIGLDILHSSHPSKTIEVVGKDHLDDLIKYGFFKKEIDEWQHTYYIMHDLLHELAVNVSSQECLHIDSSRATPIKIPPSLYHLSISLSPSDSEDGTSENGFKEKLAKIGARLKSENQNLRTLMIWGKYDQSLAVTFSDLFKSAKSLRFLQLSSMTQPVESILYSFSKLVHLRYIKLMSEDLKDRSHLPASLSRFYHLRVLDIRGWGGACTLLEDITNLSKLRHFLVPDWALKLTSDIPNIGKLSCLQELRVFKVRNNQSDGFELCELGKLTEIGGSLSILNLESAHVNEAHKAKLVDKNRLQKLALCWGHNRPDKNPAIENQVLERLRPHSNIREIKIKQNGGSTCPTWLSESLYLKDLEALHLDGANWKMLPPLGELWLIDGSSEEYFGCTIGETFQNLKRLELVGLPNLRKWVAKKVCPIISLMEVLIVENCSELTELPFSYYTPSEGDGSRATCFPKLREVKIANCPKLVSLPPIPYTKTLSSVDIKDVGTGLKKLYYHSINQLIIEGKDLTKLDDNVLAFRNLAQFKRLDIYNCPPLEGTHLQLLTSLEELCLRDSSVVFSCPPMAGRQPQLLTSLKNLELHGSSVVMFKSLGNGSKYDSEWQIPVENLSISNWHAGGKALSQLLSHLPKISSLSLSECHKITGLCVAIEEQETSLIEATESNHQQQQVEEEEIVQVVPQPIVNQGQEGEDGLLLFPIHLSNSLHDLSICNCSELRLLARPPISTSHAHEEETGGKGLQAMRCLEGLDITNTPKFLSAYGTSSCCPFPSSMTNLYISGHMEVAQTLDVLSNINCLDQLYIDDCGGDLRCEGLWPLLVEGRLSELIVNGTPRYFAALELAGLQKQQEQQNSSKLQLLSTDNIAEVLVKPLCSFLSSSLTKLSLSSMNGQMERFTKEQEGALLLLTSLQELGFHRFHKLQCLPAGLNRLTNLKKLSISSCPSIQSLPKDGLPSSLQELDVKRCENDKLKRQCRKLKGTIPEIKLQEDSTYGRGWTELDEFSR